MFQIELAEISIGLNDRYGALKTHCKDYLTDKEPLFTVSVSDEEIARAMTLSHDPALKNNPAAAEIVCAYRAICKKLPLYGVFLFHSAAIAYDQRAYLFSAPSGTGKSTHIGLWRECFGKSVFAAGHIQKHNIDQPGAVAAIRVAAPLGKLLAGAVVATGDKNISFFYAQEFQP